MSIAAQGENNKVEFKSTLRINMHTGKKDNRVEHACLKTIAGFLNSDGGTLLIGINDNGEPLGIQGDAFENEDKMNLHLVNLIKSNLGAQHILYIKLRFDSIFEKRVFVVECKPGQTPVYLKEGNADRFYIRAGASTSELSASQIHDYIQNRFGN